MGIGILYKLVDAQMPGQGDLAWAFYGGDDGSVLAFKPERAINKRWLKLTQTRTKDHGYWGVSIKRKRNAQDRIRYFQPDVQKVVLFAFEGPPASDEMDALHDDDDADNNRRDNLKWGTKSENVKTRHNNQRQDASERTARVGTRILLECVNTTRPPRVDGKPRLRTVEWVGEILLPGANPELPVRESSTNPSHVVQALLYRFNRKADAPEKTEEAFDGNVIQTSDGKLHLPVGFDICGDRYGTRFGFLLPAGLRRTR